MDTQFCNYRNKINFSDEKACKVVLSEGLHSRTTLWCLKPGQHIHPHIHAGDHVWVVLEGEGVFLSEGQKDLAITAGTIISAPAGISHGVENTGNSGLIFASVSAG